jgi:hypothetical protein
MPTRLAVGLGLESGLETGYPVSFAPSLTNLNILNCQGFWVSRIRLQEGNRISAATSSLNHITQELSSPRRTLRWIRGLNPDIATNITLQKPPPFLLQNEDDRGDIVNNSLVYYIRLKNGGVPVEMHS